MPTRHWDRSFLESSQGRIIALLRQGSRTIEELSTSLGLTGNAVRSHITVLERNGFVVPAELRRTSRKPAQAYAIRPEAEQRLSKAYAPVLAGLLQVLARRMEPAAIKPTKCGDFGLESRASSIANTCRSGRPRRLLHLEPSTRPPQGAERLGGAQSTQAMCQGDNTPSRGSLRPDRPRRTTTRPPPPELSARRRRAQHLAPSDRANYLGVGNVGNV